MSKRIARRTVLHGIGCAGCALALAHPFVASEVRAQFAFERLDDAERMRLAELALDLAARSGATHADVRICRNTWQRLQARDGRLDDSQSGTSVGFGLRLLIDGAWGFAGAETIDEPSMRRAAADAADNAAAIRRLGATPVVIEPLQAFRDRWIMPMRIDPFAVADDEKADLLLAVNAAAQAAGAGSSMAYLAAVKEEKLFANSIGSRIDQQRVRIAPGFTVTAINRATGAFATRSSMAAPRAAGWEYVAQLGLDAEAREATLQAQEKLAARRAAPGRYDLVIDATNLWLTLHETVGHATELDRALGWEANFAGTTFVSPDQRGRLQFGSALMNVHADRSRDGGLATIAYDDDGVSCGRASFPIISDGIFRNYQMSIGQAHLIGEPHSNGCAYAEGPTAFPLQRMPNISLLPSPQACTLDDLIGGVDEGIYIAGSGSFSIDQQRRDFQFGGQLFYEIKHGRRGRMLSALTYHGETLAFWNAMDGLGDRTTHVLGGAFLCAKGEPDQAAPVSHGAVAARFRGISIR